MRTGFGPGITRRVQKFGGLQANVQASSEPTAASKEKPAAAVDPAEPEEESADTLSATPEAKPTPVTQSNGAEKRPVSALAAPSALLQGTAGLLTPRPPTTLPPNLGGQTAPNGKRLRLDVIARLRLQLAAAYRLAAKNGLNEGICNHLTVSVDEDHDAFLVIPFGVSWSLVRPEQLLLVDSEGKVLQGQGEVETTAVSIHAAVHKACGSDGVAVFHTHMTYATTLAALKHEHGGKLLQVHQNSCRFYKCVEYDTRFNGLAEEAAEGQAIARRFRETIDEGNPCPRVLFHGNHGVIIVGRSVAEAWDDLYFLERACQIQVHALSAAGGDVDKLSLIDDEVAEKCCQQMQNCFEDYAAKHFNAGILELRRMDPTFAR